MVDTQEQYLKQITSLYWENGYNPDISQMERLAHFADLIVEKNAEINLISRKDIESIVENHIFLSSFIAKEIPERCTRFLDIGTGGGLPGIPIAIMKPMLRGVLVDSVKKKVDAVTEFIDRLMLNNVKAVCSRVEEPEFVENYKNSFDLIVSRATVPMIILIRYALPLIKERAHIFAMKGGDLTEELERASVKYASNVKKSTIFELHYKPNNVKNIKGKKLVLMELVKSPI